MLAALTWYGFIAVCSFLLGTRVLATLRIARELGMRKSWVVIAFSATLAIALAASFSIPTIQVGTVRWLWLLIATLVAVGTCIIACVVVEDLDKRYSGGLRR